MRDRRILQFAVTALVACLASRASAGSSVAFKAAYSGVSTTALLSFDGACCAGEFTYGELGTFGQATGQDVNEGAPDGKTCTISGHTANAGTEYTLVGDADVVRYSSSGDMQFRRATTQTSCVDMSSGTPPFPFTDNGSGTFTGGTGRFAGASGNYSFSDSGSILSLPGFPGFGSFSAAQGTVSGVVNFP